MRIGTAVPSPGQLAAVRHHFIQTISVHDYYNSWQFEVQALERIRELFQEKEVVLMTGGSMLYIDAVCKGIDDIPTISPELRTGLRSVFPTPVGPNKTSSVFILTDFHDKGYKCPHSFL